MLKRARSENKKLRRESRESWNPYMDTVLLDAFVHEYELGNKVNGTFTSQAYKSILVEVNKKLNKNLTKSNIQNRWKTLKIKFLKCYHLIKPELSGVTWDPTTKLLIAEPEVWKRLIKANPDVKNWINKPIENYDKMMLVYGKDIVTEEEHVEKDVKEHRLSEIQHELMESNHGIDNMVHQNEVIHQNFDNVFTADMDNENGQEMHSHDPTESTSKGKRSKTSKEDPLIFAITNAIQGMTEALQRGNMLLDRALSNAFPSLPISESDVFKLLKDLQIDPKCLIDAFFFLVENPKKLKAILGCPMDMRKTMILHAAFGPNRS